MIGPPRRTFDPGDPSNWPQGRADETPADLRRQVENLESTVRFLIHLLLSDGKVQADPKLLMRLHVAGLDGNELVDPQLIIKRRPFTEEDDG